MSQICVSAVTCDPTCGQCLCTGVAGPRLPTSSCKVANVQEKEKGMLGFLFNPLDIRFLITSVLDIGEDLGSASTLAQVPAELELTPRVHRAHHLSPPHGQDRSSFSRCLLHRSCPINPVCLHSVPR